VKAAKTKKDNPTSSWDFFIVHKTQYLALGKKIKIQSGVLQKSSSFAKFMSLTWPPMDREWKISHRYRASRHLRRRELLVKKIGGGGG